MASRSWARITRSSSCTPLQSGPRWRWRRDRDRTSALRDDGLSWMSRMPRIEHIGVPCRRSGKSNRSGFDYIAKLRCCGFSLVPGSIYRDMSRDPIPAAAFGAVQRLVHAFDARVPVFATGEVLNHAEAGGQLQSMLADFHRVFADRHTKPLGNPPGLLHRRARQQGKKLLAAETKGDVFAADDPTDPASDLRQHAVADLVSELVVDALEMIEVEQHDR